MTIEKKVLQKLANWKMTGEGRQTLAVADPQSGWNVQIACDRHDELGVALWEVGLCRLATPSADARQFLRQWADRVSGLTGLLEPLKLLEIDDLRVQALLRSQEPAQRDGALYYYEIILDGDRLAVIRRYRGASPSAQREQISYALTHEALAKLVQDVAGGAPNPISPS